jgi:hypothetical protein
MENEHLTVAVVIQSVVLPITLTHVISIMLKRVIIVLVYNMGICRFQFSFLYLTEMSPTIHHLQTEPEHSSFDSIARSGYSNEGMTIMVLCIGGLLISNLGTGMGLEKRQKLGLNGLLPAHIETLEIQKARALRVLRSKANLLEKYIFMAQLRTTNVRLFYRIVIDELEVL